MKTALLVIDVQQALCTGEYSVHDAEGLTTRINRLTAMARKAGTPVFWIQHEEDHELLRWGSPGWQLDSRLQPLPGDARVRKTTPDSFHDTDLKKGLDAAGIQRLIVCGLQSEYCVDSTVRAALAHGYPVVLVSDAHTTIDNGVLSASQIVAHHNATLAGMDSFGPRVSLVCSEDLRIGD